MAIDLVRVSGFRAVLCRDPDWEANRKNGKLSARFLEVGIRFSSFLLCYDRITMVQATERGSGRIWHFAERSTVGRPAGVSFPRAKCVRSSCKASPPSLGKQLRDSKVRPGAQQLEQGSSDVISLDIEARVKRCGGEMRLVFPPDHSGPTQAPASSLLKALARGRQWYEWIVAGEVLGQRAIAQRLGLNERYVGRFWNALFSLSTLWNRSSMDASR
jgi:hypothetical protein